MSEELIEKEFWDIFKKDPEEVAKYMDKMVEEKMGFTPLVLEYLSRRPDFYIHHVAQAKNIYLTPKKIPLKWVELISIGISFALKNEYCAKEHMEGAFKAGATTDEILEIMLIADFMAMAAINAKACRVIKEFEEEHKDEL